MIASSIEEYLAIGEDLQSHITVYQLSSDVLKKLKEGRKNSRRQMKTEIDIYYKLCLKHFKKKIAELTFEGLYLFLSAFERSLYMKRNPNGRAYVEDKIRSSFSIIGLDLSSTQTDIVYERFTSLRNRSLTLVIESCIIYSSGMMKHGKIIEQNLIDTIWLADRVVELARLSDTVHYLDGLEYFEILNDGFYDFRNRKDIADQYELLSRDFALENRDTLSIQGVNDPPDVIASRLCDKFRKFDSFYRTYHGFSLTESIRFLSVILSDTIDCYATNGQPEKYWVCVLPETEFLNRIKLHSSLPESTIYLLMKYFSFNFNKINPEQFPNWRYPREVTIITQSIIQLQIDNHNFVCFIPQLIAQAFGKQLSNLTGLVDETHGDKFAEKYKRELTKAFEEEVATTIEASGFETVSNLQIPPGEIDILAYHKRSDTIIIVECKAPKVRLDVKYIKMDLKKLNTWYEKLKLKDEYIRSNIRSIRRIENWKPTSNPKLVIVTQRPFLHSKKKEIPVIHFLELEDWIKSVVT